MPLQVTSMDTVFPAASALSTVPFTSGKALTLVTSWTMDVQGEKVKDSRHYFDLATILQQIGAPLGPRTA